MTETAVLRHALLFIGFIIILVFAGVWAYKMFSERGSNSQTSHIHQVLDEHKTNLVEKIDEKAYANYQQ